MSIPYPSRKLATSYRLTPAALKLVTSLSAVMGIGKGSVIETAIRELAEVKLKLPSAKKAKR